ncbi:MAG: hypothetical protein ABI409_21650 [Ramlibacter sp.]
MGSTLQAGLRHSAKGRTVTFKVEGRDSVEPICRASRNRFVVNVASTEKRLAGKAAKAGLS